ncbi:MAG: MerR family transcriptional regulator [bacterium]|nr:MerR family transcriptional regulator [bacterium]
MGKKQNCEYSIREVSQILDIPASTLRYYEELGLLPEVKRTDSGQRVYTQEQLDRLGAICCLKHTGMTMSHLQQFFQYEEKKEEYMDEILLLLMNQKEEMENRIRQDQEDLIQVKRKILFYKETKASLEKKETPPDWKDYEHADVAKISGING